MIEYITQEQAEKIAVEVGLIDGREVIAPSSPEFFSRLLMNAINTAFEQKLEIKGYLRYIDNHVTGTREVHSVAMTRDGWGDRHLGPLYILKDLS